MKVPLKRHLYVFTHLHSRLSSVRWTLLLITTAMFFLSAASTGCPTSGYTLSVAPNLGPSVSNPSPDQPPPAPPPDQPASQPVSQLPTPAAMVVIPATPASSVASNPPVAAPPPSGTTGLAAGGSPVAVPPPGGTTGSPAGGGQVEMVKMVLDPKNPSGFGFSPVTLTIKKGTKVTWVNVTAIPHTVTSDDNKFTSSSVASPVMQGQMYSFVFTTAGTFKYHCAIHPPQVGTVIVQ